MKKQRTKKIVRYKAHELPIDAKTDWKRVDKMAKQELEESVRSDVDTILADEQFWETARWVMPSEQGKERITIRIDADVLEWFKKQGRGYQSKINSILRAFIRMKKDHHKRDGSHHRRHSDPT